MMLLGLLVLLALPLAGHGAAPTVVRVRSATQGAGTPTTEEGLSFGSLRLARDHLRRLPATATDVQLLLGRGTGEWSASKLSREDQLGVLLQLVRRRRVQWRTRSTFHWCASRARSRFPARLALFHNSPCGRRGSDR